MEAPTLGFPREALRKRVGGPKPRDPIERFMKFVEPEPNTGCWLWNGWLSKDDRGMFSVGSRLDGTANRVLASRFSYEHFIGPIPDGLFVLHKCDVGPCVSPDHFFLGTRQDNNSDMARKNRGAKTKSGRPYGVHVDKRTPHKFKSQIMFLGKMRYFGSFDTVEEAAEVSAKKKIELYESLV